MEFKETYLAVEPISKDSTRLSGHIKWEEKNKINKSYVRKFL
jgi:hypothetical protein